jgi:multiple antibiotic resistance protein
VFDVAISKEFILVSATSLFTIVNPIGAVPVFYSHTSGLETKVIRNVARRAAFTFLGITLFFALTGEVVFHLMGITIPAFGIAGGILLFMVALDMLHGSQARFRQENRDMRCEDGSEEDVSIIPIGTPILAGPGAITTVIVLMSQSSSIFETVILIAIIFGVAILTYFILSQAPTLMRFIRPSGTRVMNRMMGLMVAAISVQFIVNGITKLLPVFSQALGK